MTSVSLLTKLKRISNRTTVLLSSLTYLNQVDEDHLLAANCCLLEDIEDSLRELVEELNSGQPLKLTPKAHEHSVAD